jgi:hypothetical protein
MPSRLREFLESIVFAGMKPAGPSGPKRMKWLGPLEKPLEKFLNGAAPTDPLYLSNRPLKQRLKLAAVVFVPCLVVAVGLLMALANRIPVTGAGPAPELTPNEVTQKILPHLDRNIKIDVNRDLEVMEIHIERGAETSLVCTVRNNSGQDIQNGGVIVDLTDSSGSQVGGITIPVSVAARSTKKIQMPIKQSNAVFALVRELQTH